VALQGVRVDHVWQKAGGLGVARAAVVSEASARVPGGDAELAAAQLGVDDDIDDIPSLALTVVAYSFAPCNVVGVRTAFVSSEQITRWGLRTPSHSGSITLPPNSATRSKNALLAVSGSFPAHTRQIPCPAVTLAGRGVAA
jgi:hypothetical protein